MKTTFMKTLATFACSVIAIAGSAQCPTVYGIYISQGASTATVSALMTPSTSIGSSNFYWSASPAGAYFTPSASNAFSQTMAFTANGNYSVCVNYIDSVTMCSSSTCTVLTVTSATTQACQAGFSYSTDSTCVTHFVNSSTGTNLSYRWYELPSFTLLSTQANPALNLSNGSRQIALYTYSNNQFCDSTTSVVSVNCNGGGSCNASMTYSVMTNCNAFFYNNTLGSNLTCEWRNMSLPGSPVLSTQNTFSVNLTGVNQIALYVYSGGQFCDSVSQTVFCGAGSCSASFTSYTDSNCVTHFVNTGTTIGSPSSFWTVNGNTYSSTHLNLPLSNGSYYVTLYNYSNNQFCDSTSQLVTVACGTSSASCQANSQFTVFADSVNAGNYFAYNQSTGTGSVSYLWDFGDGTTSTQQYPFHQYATPGQYIICLTVTASNGSVTCTDVSCDSSSVQRVAAAYLMDRIQVLPQGATAVMETQVLKSMNVFPNPVDNELTVEVQLSKEEKLFYTITDALGKVVDHNELNATKTVINTGNLDRGMYFLSVTSGQEVLKTTRIVK